MLHEFLYVPDLGPVVVVLAGKREAYGRAWNFAGAGAMAQREIARKVFGMAGRKPRVFALGKTSLRVIGLFDSFVPELVELNYRQTTPVVG